MACARRSLRVEEEQLGVRKGWSQQSEGGRKRGRRRERRKKLERRSEGEEEREKSGKREECGEGIQEQERMCT